MHSSIKWIFCKAQKFKNLHESLVEVQSLQLGPIFRTNVPIRTFLRKLVRIWSGFSLKSLIFCQNDCQYIFGSFLSTFIQDKSTCLGRGKSMFTTKVRILVWEEFPKGPILLRFFTKIRSDFGLILDIFSLDFQLVSFLVWIFSQFRDAGRDRVNTKVTLNNPPPTQIF